MAIYTRSNTEAAICLKRRHAAYVLAACVIVLAAGALRLVSLATMPYGMHVDEALNVIDERTIDWSHHPVFFLAKGGRESLFFYWQNAFLLGFGVSTFSVRLASATVGIATVAAEITVVRRLFGRRAGLLAGMVLATLFWHTAQSRVGLRTITLPLVVLVVVALLRVAAQRRSAGLLTLAGAAVGLSLYTYTAARALPLVVAGYLAWLMLTRRGQWKVWLAGAVGSGAACMLLLIPLALYFQAHPEALTQRLTETSAVGLSPGTDALVVAQNLVAYVQSVAVFGDIEGFINIPGRPMADPLMALLIGAGFVLLFLAWFSGGLRRRWPTTATWIPLGWDADGAWLLLVTLFALLLIPGLLSQGAPYFPRVTGVLPSLVAAPALALDWIGWRLARGGWRLAVTALLTVPVVVQGGETVKDYFGTWAHQTDRAYGNSSGATAVGLHLASSPPPGRLLVSTYEPEVPQALAPGASASTAWFQARRWLPLPPGGAGAHYLFVVNDPKLDPPPLEKLLAQHATPEFAARDPVVGVDVARGYALQPGVYANILLPNGPRATFGGRIGVTGAMISPDASDPGLFQVVLGIRAERDDPGYLSLSVRAVDDVGAIWGQQDGLGADPSKWKAGEETLVDLPLRLAGGTPPGTLHIEATVYELLTLATLPRDGSPTAALPLGSVTVKQPVPPTKDTPLPAHLPVDVRPGSGIHIIGVELVPPKLAQGGAARVDVLWTCDVASPLGTRLALTLTDGSDQSLGLFETAGGLASPTPDHCGAGTVVVDRRYLAIGARWPAGDAAVRASLVGGSTGSSPPVQLARTRIDPLTRDSSVPAIAVPINASFDDGVRLLGLRSKPSPAAGSVDVDLVWRAEAPPEHDHTVFVHLLGSDSNVLSQHDSPPASGRWPTSWWTAGQVIVDRHTLPAPTGAIPSGATLEIGLYDPANGQRLRLEQPGAAIAAGDAVRVALSP